MKAPTAPELAVSLPADPHLHHSVLYQVHIQSDGVVSSTWAAGEWFQATPFLDDFKTLAEAQAAIERDAKFRHLVKRIVIITMTSSILRFVG